MKREDLIKALLSDPNSLKKKKPFTRGISRDSGFTSFGPALVDVGQEIDAQIPTFKRYVVSQEQFLREYDVRCHDVLFNDNLPSICVKMKDGSYNDIHFDRMAIPFQELILNAQVIYLTAKDMQFTMFDKDPSDKQKEDFILFKQYWDDRNQDGMKNKMVATQKKVGDVGLLYYFDSNGEIKSRILSYEDGYVLCPHNDQNGDRILESVYYMNDDVEVIDSYDDERMYRYVRELSETTNGNDGWVLKENKKHGFKEIPLITKRGRVAWDNVQSQIDTFEEQYNIFNAIQRRFGWGIFYVKGKFNENAQKIAGSVVLNDKSIDGKGDAKFLTPPTPQGMLDTLKMFYYTIQLSSNSTFILPEDIKLSGDVSGLAVQLTKELDIQNAQQAVIDWQNVASKMMRLFKYGLAVELVNKKIMPTAITDFQNLRMSSKFMVWKPFNEAEFNQMLATLVGAGILSKQTGVEVNTVSKPDEMKRVEKEVEEAEQKEIEKQERAFKQQQQVAKNAAKEKVEQKKVKEDK